ncbi:C-terminal processing protease CtpA/Prc [Chitinophaga terrae (ex Kim and Jung 2007)]|uniref:S41 family peptidase n=1 Tax=Chitinophaga terrae (ex Kim and Jung 2007) TaxID=408074 RepID=UPI0027875CBB|nr:S41 family peptidase [Chitinophaga terrae (ex Kim and Jung 2007)]MDQ0109032.1 C-terminal processing protease CtpA/Prc [Chitinophaga terrae (ex Kim and Jung 2007)]
MQSFVKVLSPFIVLLMLSSCSKKDALPEPYPTDSLGKINRWVLDSMRRFYYWSSEIPAKPDYSLSPDLFFKSLLSVSDRFSHISGPNVPPASNAYFTYGLQYAFLQVPNVDHYIGVVTLVNKGGGAEQAGFKRGSYFSKVNGEYVTDRNLQKVNQLLNNRGSLQLTVASYTGNSWRDGDSKPVSPGFRNEDPVYYTRVFSGTAGKTGYLYYSSFNEAYDGSLLAAFTKFKNEGINDLIVDLRYNAGGSVASCAKLAGMIASGLNGGEVFAIFQGNSEEGRSSHSLQNILNTSGNPAGRQFADLQSRQLQLNRIFILTTNATVSAAEMLVNNLKPFINVIQVGEKTTGKDEASFTIADGRVPRQVDWVIQPIVYKLFNRNNEGNYAGGLVPQQVVDETSQLPLEDIGTGKDALIRKALEMIYGAGYTGEPADLRMAPLHPAIRARAVYRSAVEQAANAAPVLLRQ